VYFNINCNVFFKLIKVHLLVRERYIYQNARHNNKKKSEARIWVANHRLRNAELIEARLCHISFKVIIN